MPSSDTERSYVPFADPADRPRKSRATVRVIMINDDRTLLFEDSDPGVPGTSWWTTPGGGVDEGESQVHAAIREVAEETGYQLTESELGSHRDTLFVPDTPTSSERTIVLRQWCRLSRGVPPQRPRAATLLGTPLVVARRLRQTDD